MNGNFKNLVSCVLFSIIFSSCTSLGLFKNQSWETTLSDYVSQADTLEIPIPSYEDKTILTNANDIQAFLDIIEIDESNSDVSACFCVGNINVFFKKGTNVVAIITVKHEGKYLAWHDGLWPAYATLTKSSSQELAHYFERLQIQSGLSADGWKISNFPKRPKMKLEPLSQERLNAIFKHEIKTAEALTP
jgi:hypothetical protein